MKIAVMGAGALGCYFGGRLVSVGADVAFIARGAHLEALKQNGLRIESPLGDLTLDSVRATHDPSEIGPVDLVFLLVKLQDTMQAVEAMKPLLGDETGVLSFQNGVDAWHWIGEAVGHQRVIGGTAAIPADIREPGVVRHSGPFAKLTFGEFDGKESDRCRDLLELFKEADVDATLVPDISVKIWEKFVMLSAFSAITTLARLPIGPIRADPMAYELLQRAVNETLAVARVIQPELSEDYADAVMGFFANAPGGMRSSMLDDLSRNKPIEINHLSGAVVRLAREHGLEAPTHDVAMRALSPFANGSPNGG